MSTTHDNHDIQDAPLTGDGELYGVLAEYDTPGELIEACRRVRDAGYTEFDAYSPFPVHGIDEAMGIKRTILPLIVFGGGFTGLIGAIFLQWWMNAYNWPWNIAGKPAWSMPANVPIAFEGTILFSVFASFFGMWFERFVIIATSLARSFLPSAWSYYWPTRWDVGLFIGTIGLFSTLFLLFFRYVPVVAISEVKGVMPEAHAGKEH